MRMLVRRGTCGERVSRKGSRETESGPKTSPLDRVAAKTVALGSFRGTWTARMRRSLAAPPQVHVYFDNIPGGFHSLVERISFPALSYNDYTSTFPGKVDIDMFFTMNANEKRWEQVTKARVGSSLEPLHLLRGELRMFPVFNTLQVKDYSKYEMASFSEEDKRAARKTEFPKALEHAFKVGARTDR